MIASFFRQSPSLVRVVPFAVFITLTFCQDLFGGDGRYWFYLGKTVVGAWMLWEVCTLIPELRWSFTVEAAAAGLVVVVIWVGLDPLAARLGWTEGYPKLFAAGAAPWNPHAQFGADTALAWFFIAVRVAGSALVVPPLEEVFFRSWLYRYIANPDFESIPLGKFLWLPFVATAVVFGLEHREWLAGILAGIIYGGLVCWKKRLGDAVVAHGVTNLALGVWVVARGEWHYW